MSVLKKNLVIVLAPGVAELEGGGMRRRKRRKGVRLSTRQNLQIIPYDFRERKIQNIVGYFENVHQKDAKQIINRSYFWGSSL